MSEGYVLPGWSLRKSCTHLFKNLNVPSELLYVLSERTTLRSLYAIGRPSVVCLSVVCL